MLSRHYKTHTKPYYCDDCSRGFALKADLDRHKFKHETVTLRYHCKFSGCDFKGASRKDNLRRHIRNSHGKLANGPQEEEIKAFCSQAQLERKRLLEASNLLVAAKSGNESILRWLIDNGIDIGVKSDQGKTALHIAAM